MIGSPAPQETREAGRPSSNLRFTGPQQARKRMRLLLALGMLVAAAVTTATVASLSTGRPSAEPPVNGQTPRLRALVPETEEFLDPSLFVEAHVEQAESALAGARAAIRSARQLGIVDPQVLDEFQRRLDSATGRARAPTADAIDQPSEAPQPPVDGSPRDL